MNSTEQPVPVDTGATPLTGSAREVRVIGFGRRLVAYAIDAALLLALWILSGLILSMVLGDSGVTSGLALLLNLLVDMVYTVAFWAIKGQTPGKMALGIKVVARDGNRLTWSTAFIRYIGYWISSLVLCLGYLWIAFDARREGWHDKLAKTLVVPRDAEFEGAPDVTFVPSDRGKEAVIIVLLLLGACALPFCAITLYVAVGKALGGATMSIYEWLDAARAATPTP